MIIRQELTVRGREEQLKLRTALDFALALNLENRVSTVLIKK